VSGIADGFSKDYRLPCAFLSSVSWFGRRGWSRMQQLNSKDPWSASRRHYPFRVAPHHCHRHATETAQVHARCLYPSLNLLPGLTLHSRHRLWVETSRNSAHASDRSALPGVECCHGIHQSHFELAGDRYGAFSLFCVLPDVLPQIGLLVIQIM
jgi:hypothetical protein